MPWSQRQAQLTKEAWLHIASPEEVYRELQEVATEIAKKPFVERFDRVLANDEIELTLIERNQPLINLGLACFRQTWKSTMRFTNTVWSRRGTRRMRSISAGFALDVFQMNRWQESLCS